MKIGVVLVGFHSVCETSTIAKRYQSYAAIDDVVIVNNDSTSQEGKELEELQRDGIEVIVEKNNLGYSKGNNIGIKYLIKKGCQAIIVSNSDVIVTEKSIKNLAQTLEKKKEYGALAPSMIDAEGKRVPLRYLSLGLKRALYRIFISENALDKKCEKKILIQDGIAEQSYLPGSFFMIRKDAIEAADFFDENIFLYREEEILGERLRAAGYKEGVLLDEQYIHNHPYKEEQIKKRMKSLRMALKSEMYYFEQYKKINVAQKMYLEILQEAFCLTRFMMWKIQSMKKKAKE